MKWIANFLIYCIKSKTARNGRNLSHRFVVCKKRTPGIGFVFTKIGHQNNFPTKVAGKFAYFDLVKTKNAAEYGYDTNSGAGHYMGLLFKNVRR